MMNYGASTNMWLFIGYCLFVIAPLVCGLVMSVERLIKALRKGPYGDTQMATFIFLATLSLLLLSIMIVTSMFGPGTREIIDPPENTGSYIQNEKIELSERRIVRRAKNKYLEQVGSRKSFDKIKQESDDVVEEALKKGEAR